MAQLGQFKDANQILQKAIDKFGASPESYANMAINFLSLKDIVKGEDFFRKSLEIGPSNIPIWINLANVLSEQRDIVKKREALAIYKKYQKQTPQAFGVDSLIDVLEKEIGRQ
jgi:tetratricopeptide (TPR) repeat protein